MSRIIFGNLQSELMQRDIPYRVILPTEYHASDLFYPVLYLLHGLFGSCDNWLDNTKITQYAESFEAIIVLVEGGNGWYADSPLNLSNKFESYFIDELIPEISDKFRIDESREKRAIAGLSMGGYGSLKFAIKRPDLFCFAGSMSGAFNAPRLTDSELGTNWDELIPSISEAFGDKENITRNQNDLYNLINNISQEVISKLPYFYFDCGIEDIFLKVNRELAVLFEQRNIDFEYHEVKGGHDWNYWDQQIQVILSLVKKVFSHQLDNLK